MSNKYINVICDKPNYGAVESPQEMISLMGKVIGGGVALVATLAGGIYLIGKLGDKHKIDDKIHAYARGESLNTPPANGQAFISGE